MVCTIFLFYCCFRQWYIDITRMAVRFNRKKMGGKKSEWDEMGWGNRKGWKGAIKTESKNNTPIGNIPQSILI